MGRMLAFQDVSDNNKVEERLSCIKIDDQLDRITAICLNRQCLALACKFLNDKSAYIFFYDLTQGFRKINKFVHEGSPTDTEERYFISMSISFDTTHMATLTNLRMSTAKLYEVKKESRLMSACSWLDELKKISKGDKLAEITKITIDPNDKEQVCMSGKNHLRMWRNIGGILKPNPPLAGINMDNNFIDHVWVENNFVASITEEGKIFFISEGNTCILEANAFGTVIDKANCLLTHAKGLIVAGESGLLSFWNKTNKESTERATHERNIKIDNRGKVACLTMKTTTYNTFLAVAYRTNFISLMNLNQLLKDKGELTDRKFIDEGYHLGQIEEIDPTHNYIPVMDMDIAIHRPLIATCCKSDSTIKIWNYATFKCELARCLTSQRFNGNSEAIKPLSIAFHPSGYLLAGGFDSQAMIWHVLENDLRPFYVFSNYKYCARVRFSHTGHLLAIAQMLSSNRGVFIHNAYTMQLLHTIKLPTSAYICDIVFSEDDLLVAFCCTDGFLIVYDLEESKETMTHSSRRCAYYGCKINGPDDVLAFGSDDLKRGIIRHIIRDGVAKSIKLQVTRLMSGYFFDNENLAVGTEDGIIKILDKPLSDKVCFEISAHTGPIMRFLISPDGNYAFSCGEDGVLFIYGLKNPGTAFKGKLNENFFITATEPLSDVVLIAREKLNYDKLNIDSLTVKVQEMEGASKAVEDQLIAQYRNNINKMKEGKERAIHDTKSRIKNLEKEIKKKKDNYIGLLKKSEENHLAALADLEIVFKVKLDSERRKYMEMEQGLKEEIQSLEEVIKQKEKKRVKEVLEDNEKNTKDLEKLSKKLMELKIEQGETELNMRARIKLQEEENKKEMDMREHNIGKVTTDLKEIIKSKDEESKKYEVKIRELIADKTELQHKMKDLSISETQLQNQIVELQVQIEKLIRDRADAIEEAKKLRASLVKTKGKHKNTTKECQVLGWTTKELKEKLIPIMEESGQLKSKIKEIEGEYAEYMEIVEQQKLAQEKQESVIREQRKIFQNKKIELKDKERQLTKLRTLILEYKEKRKDDKQATQEMFEELYKTYILSKDNNSNKSEEVTGELNSQLKGLTKSNNEYEATSRSTIRTLEEVCKKQRKENVELMRELTQAREKLKEIDKYITSSGIQVKTERASKRSQMRFASSSMKLPQSLTSRAGEEIKESSLERTKKYPKAVNSNFALISILQNDKINAMNRLLKDANTTIFQLNAEINEIRKHNMKSKRGGISTSMEKIQDPNTSLPITARNEAKKDCELSMRLLPKLAPKQDS